MGRGDDLLGAIAASRWAEREEVAGLREALDRFRTLADAAKDVDDVWCNTVTDLIPVFERPTGSSGR